MRLTALSVSNWACHSDLNVDLSQGLQIEGRNGTGKSSTLKAVRFAFAKSAAGYKDKIKNGEREAAVELTYIKDGKTYCINKTLHVDKPSQAQLTCDGVIVADNPSNVAEALKDSLPEEILDNLLYVPQGEVTGIIDRLGQKGGRQELDALFGLDRLEKVYKACTDKIKEAKTKTEVYAEQLAKYPEDADKKFAEEEKTLAEEAGKLSAAREEKKKAFAETASKLLEAEKKIGELKKSKKERDELSEKISKLEVSVSQLAGKKDSLTMQLAEIRAEKAKLEEVYKQASVLEKYVRIREVLAEYKACEEKLAALASQQDDARQASELEELVAGKDGAEENLAKAEEEHGKLNQALIESEVEVAKANDYLKELSSLTGKPKCPRCGQVLSKGHLMNEIVVCEQAVKKGMERIGNIKAREADARKSVDAFKRVLDDVRGAQVRLKTLKEASARKQAERDEVSLQRESLSKRLGESGYMGEDFAVVEKHVAEYNGLKGKVEVFERKVAQEGLVEKELAGAEAEYAGKVKEKEDACQKLSWISFDPKRLDAAEAEREVFLNRKYALEGEVKEIDFKLSENKTKKEDVYGKIQEYAKAKSDRENSEANLNLLSRAREVFHTDKGLPKYLRDKYIKVLGQTLTQYFKRFNQNPAYREIYFNKDYQIQVKAGAGELSVEQLSGGEKVQMAVALRIALIEMLSPIRLLILDEPFGSLDVEHRELLGETLNKMAASWQLILVTHVHVDSLQLECMELTGY
ncbi:MAG: SMC family ATPase [Candidatus Altiarchaeota archaeon]